MICSIIFVRSSSPVSWIIRKVTKSEYSHVCISCTEDDSWIIEVDLFKRIKPRKNKYMEFESIDLYLTDNQRLKLLQFFLKQTDEKYDYKRILGIWLYLIGLTKDNNLWNAKNRTICNELIVDGLKSIGFDLPNSITPADLANVLLGRQAVCKIE